MMLLHELGKLGERERSACGFPQKGLDDDPLEGLPSLILRDVMERGLGGRAKGSRGIHHCHK
ncbi:hypothetical protein BDP81DRAFT_436550 [Colletotrichum phormii]|uniref:Uncharacterized protein n=1 Tax=Colletotrichum phormii TaxID=359342 RepID=A0AAJ0ECP6_9PEZI|nr:uncharacterized protein BDP81DRAFT_436550 [Colletotrichum phormii]KAK1624827.1 hypothetical protein BDP81DRAFT_436550 [Colletotrichum phormii]